MMDILEYEIFSCWPLILVAVVLVIYVYGVRNSNYFMKKGIPHVKPKPFIGNMGETIAKKQSFHEFTIKMYEALKKFPYGGIFNFMQPTILLRDPQLIKRVLVDDFQYFMDHRAFFHEKAEPCWGKSIFNLKGQDWREMRSTLEPFFSSSNMKDVFVLLQKCCQQFMTFLSVRYQQSVSKDGDLLILELKDFFTKFMNDVIASTAFGVEIDSFKNPKNEFYLKGQEAINFQGLRVFKLLGYFISPTIMQFLGIRIIPSGSTSFFTRLMKDVVTKRERGKMARRPDLVQFVLRAKKGDIPEEMLMQALLFFLSGFDTVSTTLCFVSHQLAFHPEVQRKLQKEIDDALVENKGNMTYEAVHSMKYLDMVVSETLRKFPPSPAVDRICVQKCTLNADPLLEMNPGDALLIPLYALQHDSQYYSDPDVFNPERFSEENKGNLNPLTFLPFGMGPRNCLGHHFALMEVKLALIHVLSRYDIKVTSLTSVETKIVRTGFKMTIEGDFWFGLKKREQTYLEM